MIPGEEFYPALKHLVSLPQWKDYEAWLDARVQELFQEFKTSQLEGLPRLRDRIQEVEWIKFMIHQLISEVEESRKNK